MAFVLNVGTAKKKRNMPLPSGFFLTDGFPCFRFLYVSFESLWSVPWHHNSIQQFWITSLSQRSLDEDVGNANFRDQIRRAESLEARGLRFLGMGS